MDEEIHFFKKSLKLENLGHGEWVDEPDEVKFRHKGFDCLIIRALNSTYFGGHLCGYIYLPEGHKLYGCKEFPDSDVHGGITFAADLNGNYAIGFDCAHSYDITPSVKMIMRRYDKEGKIECAVPLKESPNSTYKNISYVRKEITNLIDKELLDE